MTGNVEYDVRRMFKHACAFATSAVFRSKVLTLVVSVDEEQDWIFHVDFLEDLDSAFDVPQDWTGLYFPSDLPDGYVISMTDSTPPRIIYQNPLGQNFCYAEYDEAGSITVSTENATTRFINIGGIVAHLIESESSDGSAHVTTITWTNDHRWFSLTGENMTLDTLVKIAASVKKIIHYQKIGLPWSNKGGRFFICRYRWMLIAWVRSSFP